MSVDVTMDKSQKVPYEFMVFNATATPSVSVSSLNASIAAIVGGTGLVIEAVGADYKVSGFITSGTVVGNTGVAWNITAGGKTVQQVVEVVVTEVPPEEPPPSLSVGEVTFGAPVPK